MERRKFLYTLGTIPIVSVLGKVDNQIQNFSNKMRKENKMSKFELMVMSLILIKLLKGQNMKEKL